MRLFLRGFFLPLMCMISLVGLNGCAKNPTTGSDEFSTAALSSDILAAGQGLKTLEAAPEIAALLAKNPSAKAKLDATIINVEKLATTVDKATSGMVDINTGKQWVSYLANEMTEGLDIAAPLVQQFDPDGEKYITALKMLVPFVNALTQSLGVEPPATVGLVSIEGNANTNTAASVRYQIAVNAAKFGITN